MVECAIKIATLISLLQPRLDARTITSYTLEVCKNAQLQQVDPVLATVVMHNESGFRWWVTSSTGDVGLFQINCRLHPRLCSSCSIRKPACNIKQGFILLAQMKAACDCTANHHWIRHYNYHAQPTRYDTRIMWLIKAWEMYSCNGDRKYIKGMRQRTYVKQATAKTINECLLRVDLCL